MAALPCSGSPIREYCFVPAVGAISLRGPATHDDLCTPISEEDLEETSFRAVELAPRSDTHTPVTEELSRLVPGPAAVERSLTRPVSRVSRN